MKPTKTSLRARMKDDHNGALVATGKVTLRGGAAMKADSLAAVLAGDDLTIAGTAGVPSNFTGLLYTEGDLALSNTRTVGAAVGAGKSDGGSKMTIVDSEVLSSPEGQDVEILIHGPTTARERGGIGSRGSGDPNAEEPYIEPKAVDLLVNGEVQTDPAFIRSLVKISIPEGIFDSPEDLPSTISEGRKDGLIKGHADKVRAWTDIAHALNNQNRSKVLDIVRFDLNEFLNVSDRLRSSRPFYIEG